MHLLFVLFFVNILYTFRLHNSNLFMYSEMLFTVSTSFSTGGFEIILCRNLSFYGVF